MIYTPFGVIWVQIHTKKRKISFYSLRKQWYIIVYLITEAVYYRQEALLKQFGSMQISYK